MPGPEEAYPAISDNEDEMVRLLRQIAENTGSLDVPDFQREITLEGDDVTERVGLVPHRATVISESAQLDEDKTTDDGAVRLAPGDEKTLCEYRGTAHAIIATGATDRANLLYRLDIDGEPALGPTFGPLGTLNSPFSFVDSYGGAIPADSSSRLVARYPESGSGEVEVVGRNHVEVIQQ